jgi:hypothetical protein
MPAEQKQLIHALQIAAHKTLSAPELLMRTKLEHLLFRSMWETYFCMRFQNRNGRLKPLQSFCY